MLYLTVVLAVITGLLSKGSIRNLLNLKLKSAYLIILFIVAKYSLEYLSLEKYSINVYLSASLHFFMYGFLFLFLLRNINIPGLKIILFGAIINLVMILINQGIIPINYPLIIEGFNMPLIIQRVMIDEVIISLGVFYTILATMHVKHKSNYRLDSFLSRQRI